MKQSWDEYFLSISKLVANRSTCLRRQVGAVLVKDKRILATGYNGVPSGITHCTPDTCIRKNQNIPSGERHELCRGLHAEQNALIQLARYGASSIGCTIYITTTPCIICSKMLINAGITRIVTDGEMYNDPLSFQVLSEANIKIEYI